MFVILGLVYYGCDWYFYLMVDGVCGFVWINGYVSGYDFGFVDIFDYCVFIKMVD